MRMKVLAEMRASVWMTTLLLGLAGPALAQSESDASADGATAEEAPATEASTEEAPAEEAAAEATGEETPSTDEEAAGDFSGAVDTEGDIEDRVSGTSEPKFIKGHLVHPGTREYLSRYDHFGIRMGPAIIDNDFYAMVDPGIAMAMTTIDLLGNGGKQGERIVNEFRAPLSRDEYLEVQRAVFRKDVFGPE